MLSHGVWDRATSEHADVCASEEGNEAAVIDHGMEIAEEIDDAPIVLVVDDYTCVTLGAELLERGRDFACYSTVATMVVSVDAGSLGVPFVLVVDQITLSERDRMLLAGLHATGPLAASVLLASGLVDASRPWDRIVHRPIASRELADILDEVLRSSRQERSRHAGQADLPGFELRMGRPWPIIRCSWCGGSRHCETPRTTREGGLVRQEVMKFLLAHEHHGKRRR